jgi:hypothetical protein
MSNDHRVKIQNSNILNSLVEHVEGKREMSATQVTAGLGLLRKVLPDLNAMTIGGDDENPINIIARLERLIVDPANSDSKSIQAASSPGEV